MRCQTAKGLVEYHVGVSDQPYTCGLQSHGATSVIASSAALGRLRVELPLHVHDKDPRQPRQQLVKRVRAAEF